MAKIKGPLFSVTAEGTFGPRLTFSRRTSGQQVRYQRAQVDYENEARLEQRTFFRMAVEWWHDLTPDEQDEWNTIAATDC